MSEPTQRPTTEMVNMMEGGHRAYFKFDTQTVLLLASCDEPPPPESSVPIWGIDFEDVATKIHTILDQRDLEHCYFERGPRNEVVPVYPPVVENTQLELF